MRSKLTLEPLSYGSRQIDGKIYFSRRLEKPPRRIQTTVGWVGTGSFSFKRFNGILKMFKKRGEILPNCFPYDVVIYVEVGVDESIS